MSRKRNHYLYFEFQTFKMKNFDVSNLTKIKKNMRNTITNQILNSSFYIHQKVFNSQHKEHRLQNDNKMCKDENNSINIYPT